MATETRHTTSLEQFAETHGYFPATVEESQRHADGMELVTIDGEHESDIIIFNDGQKAVRREHLLEEPEE